MSEQEEKRARLYEQMESGAATVAATTDEHKNREKSAQTWVQHFNAVLDLIESTEEQIRDNKHLVDLLVKSWESKAKEKDENLINRLAKLKA